MPELPEVETIKRQLEKKIVGKKIKSVEVRVAKLVNLSIKKFEKEVAGKTIKKLERRAKLLIWKLSGGMNLVIHLKMTGQVIWAGKEGELKKYTYIIFTLSDNNQVFYNDWRMFGWVKLVDDKELEKISEEFGPEPLGKDFTLVVFKEMLGQRKRSTIKPLLLDQKWLAGVGNIYAQEACFCAKILPTRKAGDLNDKEIRDLYNCIKKILQEAIKWHGTSADAYVDAYGEKGKFESRLKVYGREGEKCYRCGGKIAKNKLGGRGTCYCPKCQK